MDGERNRPINWNGVQSARSRNYRCAYCGNGIASDKGWFAAGNGEIRLCPHCLFPTFFGLAADGKSPLVIPAPPPGRPVAGLPVDVGRLYEEARQSAAAGAYTASVLVCRKMIVDLAVDQGDKYEREKRFGPYVEFLANKILAPSQSTEWLDRIREQGNKATHELGVMGEQDALLLLTFMDLILRILYEFPAMLAANAATPDTIPGSHPRGNSPNPRPSLSHSGIRDGKPSRRP